MASVIIHGFKNDDCAKEFINWFNGQGEDDQEIWFECRQDEGLDVIQHVVDCYKSFPLKQGADGNWVLIVKP